MLELILPGINFLNLKTSTMKNFSILLALMLLTFTSKSQAVFNTFASGNWTDIGTWNIVSGTDDDNIPDADDNVTILDGHNILVSSNEAAVMNLTLQGTTGTRLNVNGTAINIYGTLTGPSYNFINEVLSTNNTGLIRFKGGPRALFGIWSMGSTTAAWLWRMEVALDSTAIGTASGVRASYMKFVSGIYSGSELRVDSTFSDGTGVIIIDKGATVRFSTSIGTRLVYYTPSYCRSITVNGVLESTSTGYIAAQSVTINGTLRNRGYYPIVSYPNGIGVTEFVFGNKSVMEYATTGELNAGDELDRSTLPNNVLDTVYFNGGDQYTPGTLKLNNDTLSAKNVKFGTYGRLLITLGRLVLSENAKFLNADKENFIATVGGDVLMKGIGSSSQLIPVGPSLTEYNPVTISNSGVVDDFIVKALSSRPPCLGAFPLTSINYQWDIKEAVAGGSNISLSLGYSDITKRGSQYITANAEVVHCNGTSYDKVDGSGESGADPYTVTGSGFTQFSLFGITSDQTVLPLTFIKSFNAETKNNDVALTWTVNCTAEEVIMELQNSSGNMDNFSTLYKINANADQCKQPFNYLHYKSAYLDNYYQLKITDIDGSISYSSIIHHPGNGKGIALNILPNPVQGSTLNIQVISDRITQLEFNIIDINGRIIKKLNQQAVIKGTNILTTDISNLNKGIYFISCLENGNLIQHIRMIKQ